MCSCNKGLPAGKSPLVSSAYAMSNGSFRYSSNDFVVKYYVGETGLYTGSATGIEYGYRTYNAKTMVHTNDYEVDSHLFSDEPVNAVMNFVHAELSMDSTIENNEEEDLVFVASEVETQPKTRSRKKKEVETDGENTL